MLLLQQSKFVESCTGQFERAAIFCTKRWTNTL